MTAQCTRCGAAFDTKDGGTVCASCGDTFCPQCYENTFGGQDSQGRCDDCVFSEGVSDGLDKEKENIKIKTAQRQYTKDVDDWWEVEGQQIWARREMRMFKGCPISTISWSIQYEGYQGHNIGYVYVAELPVNVGGAYEKIRLQYAGLSVDDNPETPVYRRAGGFHRETAGLTIAEALYKLIIEPIKAFGGRLISRA